MYGLGGEFLRWEIAVATAGHVLGIDPFDQPNVQESKDNTKRLLAGFIAGGELLEETPEGDGRLAYRVHDDDLPAALSAFLAQARSGDYVAIQAYVAPTRQVWGHLQALRLGVRDRLRLATTLGYGPRFLHSTGQLHKGGPNTGLFLQLVADDPAGRGHSRPALQLQRAQASAGAR